MNVPHYIKEALEHNEGYNPMSAYLKEYYAMLLRKADAHHKVVQTNKDDGFIQIYEDNKQYLND